MCDNISKQLTIQIRVVLSSKKNSSIFDQKRIFLTLLFSVSQTGFKFTKRYKIYIQRKIEKKKERHGEKKKKAERKKTGFTHALK